MTSILDMTPSKLRPTPLYRYAVECVLARLQANEWQEGEALPSEFQLASQHQVSQGTMRKALDLLVDEGILLRRQGAGTFVAAHQDSLGEARAAPLGGPSVRQKIRFELLSIIEVPAHGQIAEELSIRANTPLWEVTRLLRVDTHLFGIDQAFLPVSIFPSLKVQRLYHWNANLKQMCLIDFGVHLTEKDIRYRAVLPNQEICRFLQTTQTMPLLERIRVAHTTLNQPVLWGVTMLKTNELSFCPHRLHIS